MVNGVVIAMTDAQIPEFNASLPTEAELLARKWERVRQDRNGRLAVTDWRAGSDLTLSDAWRNYRQALRDVPTPVSYTHLTLPTICSV